MMRKAYIIDAKRTPVGKVRGLLSKTRGDDLLVHAIKSVLIASDASEEINKNIDDIETPIKLDNIMILPYSYHRYWEDGEIKYVYHAGGSTPTKFERIKGILKK